MSEYEIGRDLQELRSRLESLEASLGGRQAPLRMRGAGRAEAHQTTGGIEPKKKPLIWKPEKDTLLPPLFSAMLRIPHGVKYLKPESRT